MKPSPLIEGYTMLATATPDLKLLKPDDHTLTMIDSPSRMAFATNSIDPVLLRSNAALVAAAASGFGVSTILTTAAEKSFSGPMFEEVTNLGELEFNRMREVYAASGGMLSADELAVKQGQRFSNGLGVVARWIVSRRVVTLHWRGDYWLPLFQFTRPSMLLREPLVNTLNELNPVLEDWNVASWFATANEWLEGSCPACALAHTPHEVFNAARAYRFAIRG